jgi:hypothetical protein
MTMATHLTIGPQPITRIIGIAAACCLAPLPAAIAAGQWRLDPTRGRHCPMTAGGNCATPSRARCMSGAPTWDMSAPSGAPLGPCEASQRAAE